MVLLKPAVVGREQIANQPLICLCGVTERQWDMIACLIWRIGMQHDIVASIICYTT